MAYGVAKGLLDQEIAIANAAVAVIVAALAAAGSKARGSGPWQFTRKAVGLPLAIGIIEGFRSVMATRGSEFAKAVMGPWYSVIKTLGPDLAARLVKSINVGMDKVKTAGVKGLGNAAGAIIAAAKKYGVDARAALAVAMGEGGTSYGQVGDKGTSFGPFQQHIGGANPYGDPAAGSRLLEQHSWYRGRSERMAEAGAKGKVGLDAIQYHHREVREAAGEAAGGRHRQGVRGVQEARPPICPRPGRTRRPPC